MNINTEIQEDHQAKIRVEIETDVFDRFKRRSAKKISKGTKIPGFRPGKAPFPVVQRHVGEAAILEEALDMLIDEIYPQVIEQSEIQPYGPGRLEDLESTDPPILQFLVPLSPDVELGDYTALAYPYEPPQVAEEEVQEVLKQVQENQAISEPVERAAEEGDIVYVRISGNELIDGSLEANTGEQIPERRLNMLVEAVEEQKDSEWPFPGFSRKLIGLQAGDSTTMEYSYPLQDEGDENLAGKVIRYEVNIDEVKSRELPEIDDDLAQTLGDYEDLDALKAYIKETLLHNKMHEYNNEYDDQLLEDLLETSTIKYPPQMLADEISAMTDQLTDQLGTQGLDLDTYLKTQDLDEAGLQEEFRPRAENRIKRGLILFEIANAEELEVTPDEVQEEVNQTIGQLMQVMPEDEARRRLSGDAIQNLVSQIMSDKLAQRASERLRAIASGMEIGDTTEEPDEPSEAVEEHALPSDVAIDETAADEEKAAPIEAQPTVELEEAPKTDK